MMGSMGGKGKARRVSARHRRSSSSPSLSTLSALLLLLPRRRPRPVRLWSPSPLSSFSSPLYVALALSLSHEVQRQSRLPALPPGAAKQPTKQPGKSE
jgi:hypothetical protein